MLAVDTNLVVRYLVSDDVIQTERARSLIENESVFIPLSGLLETEWVLRDIYGLSRVAIIQAFEKLAGLATVEVEEPSRLRQALDWLGRGFDFADALHLAGAAHCRAFLTYDKAFIRAAKSVSTIPVAAPE